MVYTTIAIIFNPNSTGSSKALARDLKRQLNARLKNQKIELIATKYAGHAEELAYTIAKASANPLIISSSGDGGYNEVVNGIMKATNEGRAATAGLLPAGNANDHYHNLHEQDIVEQIVTNQSRKIDLLKITGTFKGNPVLRYAHSYIGFGFTPEVGKELNKTKLNRFNETWIVVRSLFTLHPVHLTVDKKTRLYESIILSNVDVMSKYLKISKPSSLTDGKFEVTIFVWRSRFTRIAQLLTASITGVQEDRKVSKFSLKTVKRALAQADGELIHLDARSEVFVQAEKQALTCIV